MKAEMEGDQFKFNQLVLVFYWGWSVGAMVLCKFQVLGRPTYLDNSGAKAYCACSRCGRDLFGHFSLICYFSFLSPPLWETTWYHTSLVFQMRFQTKVLSLYVYDLAVGETFSH